MADHPRRGGRNRPDSKAMWDESDQRNRYGGGGARDRRDDRDRYRDDGPRHRDRRQRSRSRSPLNDRRDPRDRRDRDRDRDRDRRRGYERERDSRRRDDHREEEGISRARRGDKRRSATPPKSPIGKVGRANHDSHSPLPTRTRHPNKGSGTLSVRDDADDDDTSQKIGSVKNGERERKPKPTSQKDGGDDAMDEDEDDVAVEDDEMSAMQAMMGFGGFGTTKGQKVPGNNSGAVYKAKKTEYRQYMNRIGGFNRPLSPGR